MKAHMKRISAVLLLSMAYSSTAHAWWPLARIIGQRVIQSFSSNLIKGGVQAVGAMAVTSIVSSNAAAQEISAAEKNSPISNLASYYYFLNQKDIGSAKMMWMIEPSQDLEASMRNSRGCQIDYIKERYRDAEYAKIHIEVYCMNKFSQKEHYEGSVKMMKVSVGDSGEFWIIKNMNLDRV